VKLGGLVLPSARTGPKSDPSSLLEKVRDDHLGSPSVDGVALLKCAAEQFLLGGARQADVRVRETSVASKERHPHDRDVGAHD